MIKRMYDWTLSMAGHPRALWALGVSWPSLKARFFQFHRILLLIPLILAAPTRAFWIALYCRGGLRGGRGMFGYLIGAFAFEALGQPILSQP